MQTIWASPSEFVTYRLCEQRRFRRACVSAQSRQNLRCLLIQAVSQEEPSNGKPDPWPLWIAGHAQYTNSLDSAHMMFSYSSSPYRHYETLWHRLQNKRWIAEIAKWFVSLFLLLITNGEYDKTDNCTAQGFIIFNQSNNWQLANMANTGAW